MESIIVLIIAVLWQIHESPSSLTHASVPVLHMRKYQLRSLLRTVLSSQSLHKIALGAHQVKVDAVVHQVVLPGRRVARRAKVHSVRLAHGFDVVVGPCQTNELWMELGKVLLELRGTIARRIAGHKYAVQLSRKLLLDRVKHDGHLVEFFGANIRAVSEAKIDLDGENEGATS